MQNRIERGECAFWDLQLDEETWEPFIVLTPLFLAGKVASEGSVKCILQQKAHAVFI